MSLLIQDLSQKFKSGPHLFRGLNLSLEGPQIVCLVGPSGCGKSSLLRLIAGLEKPSRGDIRNGFQQTSFVFQEPRLLPWRNVHQNLNLPFELRTGQEAQASVLIQTLAMLGLAPPVLKLYPHQLSGGMKMRISLARALLQKPDLLLMDEPLAALDENTRLRLQEEISRLQSLTPRLTIFVTHSLSEAVFLADRILVLNQQGELVRDITNPVAQPRTAILRDGRTMTELQKSLSQEFQTLLTAPSGER